MKCSYTGHMPMQPCCTSIVLNAHMKDFFYFPSLTLYFYILLWSSIIKHFESNTKKKNEKKKANFSFWCFVLCDIIWIKYTSVSSEHLQNRMEKDSKEYDRKAKKKFTCILKTCTYSDYITSLQMTVKCVNNSLLLFSFLICIQ